MLVACAAVTAAYAQPKAIGGRIGYGIGASYIHGLTDATVLNVDLSIPSFNGIEVQATHDWVFPIKGWEEAGAWEWFAGAGAAAGYYGFSYAGYGYGYAGAAGRVGVLYRFDSIPLELSLDYSLVLGLGFNSASTNFHGGYTGFGLAARYVF